MLWFILIFFFFIFFASDCWALLWRRYWLIIFHLQILLLVLFYWRCSISLLLWFSFTNNLISFRRFLRFFIINFTSGWFSFRRNDWFLWDWFLRYFFLLFWLLLDAWCFTFFIFSHLFLVSFFKALSIVCANSDLFSKLHSHFIHFIYFCFIFAFFIEKIVLCNFFPLNQSTFIYFCKHFLLFWRVIHVERLMG